MIHAESIFNINCQIIDPVIMREVKSQIILSYQVNNKKLYNKKAQKLYGQISKLNNQVQWLGLKAKKNNSKQYLFYIYQFLVLL